SRLEFIEIDDAHRVAERVGHVDQWRVAARRHRRWMFADVDPRKVVIPLAAESDLIDAGRGDHHLAIGREGQARRIGPGELKIAGHLHLAVLEQPFLPLEEAIEHYPADYVAEEHAPLHVVVR